VAFPVIQTADSQHGVVTTNSTTWTLTYPTNLASGDLILAFIGRDGGTGVGTWPANWSAFTVNQGATCLNLATKLSDGTETGTFNVTGLPSEQGGWRVLRVTGWSGGYTGIINNGVNDSNGVKSSSATGTSANPDCPSNNPINWDVEDTLWIAVCSVDTSRTFSAWPSGYSPGDNTWDDVSGGANGASLSVQWRNSAAASEDPGAWTISASDDWAATLLAVRPAAAVAAVFTRKEFPALQAVNRASVY
jgi:hypothetical protein